MDVFKAFPMINYKSECLMYSFTSDMYSICIVYFITIHV